MRLFSGQENFLKKRPNVVPLGTRFHPNISFKVSSNFTMAVCAKAVAPIQIETKNDSTIVFESMLLLLVLSGKFKDFSCSDSLHLSMSSFINTMPPKGVTGLSLYSTW